MIGLDEPVHQLKDAVLVLLTEIGLGIKPADRPRQLFRRSQGKASLIGQRTDRTGDRVSVFNPPIKALAVKVPDSVHHAVRDQIIPDQRQILLCVQFVELRQKARQDVQVLFRLRKAFFLKLLQNGQLSLQLHGLVIADGVVDLREKIRAAHLFLGQDDRRDQRLKGKAVFQLLRRLFLAVPEPNQHLLQQHRDGILLDFAVFGEISVLGRILEQKIAAGKSQYAVAGIHKVWRGTGVPETCKLLFRGRLQKIPVQRLDAVHGLDRVRRRFQRGSAPGVAAFPVHHQVEQVIGQPGIMRLRPRAEEHLFGVLHVLQLQVCHRSAGGNALRNPDFENFLLVDGEGKVILQRGRGRLGHGAVQVTVQPGCAGGIVCTHSFFLLLMVSLSYAASGSSEL